MGEVYHNYYSNDIYKDNIIVNAASMDPDTMYLHQAMKEEDWPKFLEAMKKEVKAHMDNKIFVLYDITLVPNKKDTVNNIVA